MGTRGRRTDFLLPVSINCAPIVWNEARYEFGLMDETPLTSFIHARYGRRFFLSLINDPTLCVRTS